MVRIKDTNPKGLNILSNPLFSKMVDSSKIIGIIGVIILSPGTLNQTVTISAKEKLKTIILKNVFFTNKDNKRLIKQERKKYVNQKKIIKNYQ